MKIILLGYMGSGKSKVGSLLGSKLNLPFLDLDSEIEKVEQRKIPQVFKESGEIYFRKKETEVMQNLLMDPQENIIALGGGTPCYGNNLSILKQTPDAILVYLKTSLGTLKERLLPERKSRPLISHLESEELLEDFLRKHLFERVYYYNQSHQVVETDSKTPEAVCNEIIKRLHQDRPVPTF